MNNAESSRKPHSIFSSRTLAGHPLRFTLLLAVSSFLAGATLAQPSDTMIRS